MQLSIERIYYCDGPECDAHCRTATPPPHLPPGFLEVREGGPDERGDPPHFCTWDCLMKYAAKNPPSEIIPWIDEGTSE